MKKVKLYALSTCGWCRKTKNFLNENNVVYDVVDVDLLSGEDRQEVMAEVQQWNPRRNFPTIVVDDKEVVVGFNEARLREVLDL